MLRCAMNGAPLAPQAMADSRVVEWIILSGLGPLACYLIRSGGVEEDQIPEAIRGAELTGRLQTRNLTDALASTLDVLADAGIAPVAMKGITFAHGYYPQPHLRIMKDVDLLVSTDRREPAEAALLAAGFVRGDGMTFERYLPHHHAAPLYHAEKQLWVEIHSALLPPAARASAEAPFNYTSLAEISRPGPVGPGFSSRLSPEVELMLLATAWCRDLGDDFGEPGLQRRLFDAVFLLREEPELDWEKIQAWSNDTLVGKCCGVLLSYLARHTALPASALQTLGRMENQFQGRRVTGLTHNLLDRYLLADRHQSRWFSRGALANTFTTLLAPTPPWQSVAGLPLNVLFPQKNGKRFAPAFHWQRLRSYVNRVWLSARR